MYLDIRRKVLLFILSFAFANVALYSIVNFHQNRIFNIELIHFDKYFIKSKNKYLKVLVAHKLIKYHIGSSDIEINTNYSKEIVCISQFSNYYPFIDEDILSGISVSIAPIRGSPIA